MAKVCVSSDIIMPFTGECDLVAWLKKGGACDETSAGGWCGEPAAIVLGRGCTGLLYRGRGRQPKEHKSDWGPVERGIHRWCIHSVQEADHDQVDMYVNIIRQLVGLAGFKRVGLKWLTKLTFITGFPDIISIGLRQVLNMETLTMEDLIAGARVLATTGEKSQDVVTAVCSSDSSAITPTRSSPGAYVIWYRCSSKDHTAKDCQKRTTLLFVVLEV